MAAVGTLADEAKKRKERLKAMRQRVPDLTDEDNNDEQGQTEKEKLPRPIFRSYKPETETLKEQAKPTAKPADVKEAIQDQLDAGKTDHKITDVDLTNLAPRKPDWDLKRDISKKLEKLERRTQKAIAELIRERLKASQEDLVLAVNAGEALRKAEAQDDAD